MLPPGCYSLTHISAGASAQQRTTVDNGAEMQTLYATPEDIAQGKILADQSCAGCHGPNGISETPAVRILPASGSLIFLELKAYQAGLRGDNPMNGQVKFLSDDALLKVSAYFAVSIRRRPGRPIVHRP